MCAVALLTLVALMACFVRRNQGGKYAGTPPPSSTQRQDMFSMEKGQLLFDQVCVPLRPLGHLASGIEPKCLERRHGPLMLQLPCQISSKSQMRRPQEASCIVKYFLWPPLAPPATSDYTPCQARRVGASWLCFTPFQPVQNLLALPLHLPCCHVSEPNAISLWFLQNLQSVSSLTLSSQPTLPPSPHRSAFLPAVDFDMKH